MRPNKSSVSAVVLILLCMYTAAFAGQKEAKPATIQEDSFMFGRILGAVEDLGGGYDKEALHKLTSINKDLEKRRYGLRTSWTGHRYYGEALLRGSKREEALRVLEVAEKEAAALTEKERKETADLLKQARTD